MLTKFRDFVVRHDLFDPHDRILLAISGGLDSMVMLQLFREGGFRFSAAHCNFRLRGSASDEDEDFVLQFCRHTGIECFIERFDTKNYAEQSRLSVQMAARELRYAWFTRLMEKEKFHWLATAHHLNDNLETVLLRWSKGSGLDQLTGIPLKTEKIVRPLLFAKREELEAYATEKKLKWKEDASNITDDYQRNFIRHQIVPRLKEINPSLEDTFVHTLEKLEGAREMMRRGLEQLKDNITREEGDRFFIDKSLLLLLKNPAFVCYEWLRGYQFEWDRCQQLVDSLQSQPGKQFFSSTHVAVIDREFIIVSPRDTWSDEILIEEGQDKAQLGPWQLTMRRTGGNEIAAEATSASVDYVTLKFPLRWRRWKQGDVFIPL